MAHGFSGVKNRSMTTQPCLPGSHSACCSTTTGHSAHPMAASLRREPYQHICDWRDAITFGLAQPECDDTATVGGPKPLLIVVDIQREAFATAGDPKELVMHPRGHFDSHSRYFGIAGYAARDWFIEQIPVM